MWQKWFTLLLVNCCLLFSDYKEDATMNIFIHVSCCTHIRVDLGVCMWCVYTSLGLLDNRTFYVCVQFY